MQLPAEIQTATLTMRPYGGEEDYWRVREFLRRTMILNQRHEYNWHVARLDYWWWFANPDLEHFRLEETVFLWETAGGEIAAVLNPEGHGQAFLQVDPEHHAPDLECKMIAVAEERLMRTDADGRKRLWVFVDSQDRIRQEVLTRRGFQRVQEEDCREYQHRRSLDAPLPAPPSVPGYTIRPLGHGLELLERCYASGLGFHSDDIHTARENRDQPAWYRHIQSAPLYRRDLDIVAVADDGSIAAFCTVWFDDVARTAYFEPVATIPAHRRHGLARAVMIEGLHRLKRMGCKIAFVGGYSKAANAVYFSVMGSDHNISEPWEKQR